jgi:hypothetical protein
MFAENKSHPKHHLTGRRFGRLKVLEFAGSHRVGTKQSARRFWLCRCDCGERIEIRTDQLTHGIAESCGCLQRELAAKIGAHTGKTVNVTHGQARTWPGRSSEYSAWQTMKARCSNPKASNYKLYGGRGITVCKRWRDSFEAFFADMGSKPSPRHSIDRKNTNGNYNKRNCRWATAKEQANNRR